MSAKRCSATRFPTLATSLSSVSSVSPTPAASSRNCCRSGSWSTPPSASRRCARWTWSVGPSRGQSRTPRHRLASRLLRVVSPVSQLPPPGTLASVFSDGKEFVIANAGGRYYAVDGRCEHAGARLVGSRLIDCHLVCPLHGWTCDMSDGSIVKPPLARRRIRNYTVPAPLAPITTVSLGRVIARECRRPSTVSE